VTPRALVFLHVRKTGGQTFTQIVERHFGRRAVVELKADTLEGCAEQWRALPAQRRAGVRCLRGHMVFGVDELLGERADYITFLRDPIERVISAYYFYLRRPDGSLHRAIVENRMSLEDFVVSDAARERVQNAAVRMIAGAQRPGEPADALARAKQHIEERFVCAGLLERFDESCLLAGRLLGWRNVLYQKTNYNKRRPPAEVVPEAVRAVIADRNGDDLELYRWVAGRLAEKLAAHTISARELRRYQTVNAYFGFARRVVGLPRAVYNDARAALRRRSVLRGLTAGR
jgi:hypothetical protein